MRQKLITPNERVRNTDLRDGSAFAPELAKSSKLSRLFKRLDESYFKGSLGRSGWRVRTHYLSGEYIVAQLDGKLICLRHPPNQNGLTVGTHRVILIADGWEALAFSRIEDVLLHEMAHAVAETMSPDRNKERDSHRNPIFLAELRRLAAAGVALAGWEYRYYRAVPKRKRENYQLDDWALEQPDGEGYERLSEQSDARHRVTPPK